MQIYFKTSLVEETNKDMIKEHSKESLYIKQKLRDKTCKPRLKRWFVEAGLTDLQDDIMTRIFIKGQLRGMIAQDLYRSEATISRFTTQACVKLYDYLNLIGCL